MLPSHWTSKGTVIARIPPIAEYEFILGPAQTLRLNTDIDSILKLGMEGKSYHLLFGILYPKTAYVAAQEVGSAMATMSGAGRNRGSRKNASSRRGTRARKFCRA